MPFIKVKAPIATDPSGFVTVWIDEEDADLAQYNWGLAGGSGGKGKYAARLITVAPRIQRTIYMHRVIAERMGLIVEVAGIDGSRWKQSIDHENGDKLDCRRGNLRLRTRKQQMSNLNDGLSRRNKSGYRGVSFIRAQASKRPWYASVRVDDKEISLGKWATFEEAVAARRAWDEHGIRPGQRKNITHCPRNHEYTPENTRVFNGCKRCLACQREKAQEKRDRENPNGNRRIRSP